MPNARSKDQRPISFWLDAELLREIDRRRGYKERSQFIREAIAEKLARMGLRVPERLIYPPARAKVIQIGVNNRSKITLRAADHEPPFRVKKKKGKK